jgi:hypothetical protein
VNDEGCGQEGNEIVEMMLNDIGSPLSHKLLGERFCTQVATLVDVVFPASMFDRETGCMDWDMTRDDVCNFIALSHLCVARNYFRKLSKLYFLGAWV